MDIEELFIHENEDVYHKDYRFNNVLKVTYKGEDAIVTFSNNSQKTYHKEDIVIKEKQNTKDIFNYLKEISKYVTIEGIERKLLNEQIEKINNIRKASVLSYYLYKKNRAKFTDDISI